MTAATKDPARVVGKALPVLGVDERLDADTVELNRALTELVRVYQFRDRDRICCYDVSVSQCYALEATVLEGPLGVNDLAARLYLDKSTTSRVVDALEKKGYVERRESAEDRRAVRLVATGAGRELHARIQGDILAQERELLAEFSPEVRQSMAKLIGQLARAAAARVDTTGGACCAIR
ncbi:MAG TPA: MarR family transcriptional regulator [Longimicrobiaceae bacterium]|jgi:DNA-binding MarR family transcriptional regulator|nr:MarR family transcriptional regulator [Longimicrobiaceae bacterium]